MNPSSRLRASRRTVVKDADADAKPLSSGDKAADKEEVARIAADIGALQDVFYAEHRHKVLLVLQGMDTSGKDGTISHVFGQTDPLGIRAVAFKAPTQAEREHDYLWRIHQQVPAQGEIVIFNRSHYEDVLVPLVHGTIDDAECRRRYAQIRDFERMLAETGTTILKFFLHISKDEQKRRLEARLANPDKHWKFDPHDLEERNYWNAYQKAYQRAIRETDADHAPWYVIPADSKTHRNLAIAAIVSDALRSLRLAYPPSRPELAGLRVE